MDVDKPGVAHLAKEAGATTASTECACGQVRVFGFVRRNMILRGDAPVYGYDEKENPLQSS